MMSCPTMEACLCPFPFKLLKPPTLQKNRPLKNCQNRPCKKIDLQKIAKIHRAKKPTFKKMPPPPMSMGIPGQHPICACVGSGQVLFL